ncbi:MAG: MMPL family transporter [Prevotella sp.]|nr:MMPL family transporter [Prevotella sp.]
MKELALRIYDWMSGHRWWCLASLAVVTLLMVLSVTRLSYREDIRDFLPLDEKERAALNDYDRQAQTSLIVAIIEQRDSTVDDPDLLVEGVETFLDAIDGLEGVTVQTDFSQMEEQQEEAYRQLPYLLEAADYQRMDSLLRQPEFMASRLQEAKERLLMPMGMGSMVEDEITHDPLGLFSPVVSLMRDTAMLSRFDIYDGCLLTADHRRALVMLTSSYGGSETASNERLLDLLNAKADSVSRLLIPDSCLLTPLVIRFCGAPVVAVTNASQIKTDSLLSVCIAAVLILLLLWFFLRSLRHILLIALTIGWGWVFAIACLSWVHQEVSVIVIGISSIIVGIAVNYPLHLIAHLGHTSDVRQALQEIVKPLVVGNITTVGAFLALAPLRAAALRDLGLFSSFLLIGTILFTLIWLPQLLRFTVYGLQFTDDLQASHSNPTRYSSINYKLSSINTKLWLIGALAILTAFFGYHSLHTTFDADLTHINYMTPVQRSDMALLQQLMPTDSQRQQELNRRIPTTPEAQQERLQLWQSWTSSHRDQLSLSLRDEATKAGFTPDSFDPFFALLSASDISPSSFLLPPSSNYSSNYSSLFSSIASHLSDDFNYIGWACACIVFFFLWASFRSLPLALLSFLPMAVSWLWILGIMALLGIQFNIINIILSTFIFGQGDDYTIFMTEGTVYEYKHHRPMLASYRRAIMLSALIMFIGIGSLIIARHPALHSLAEVTIVGMFSVVLMAFVIPPLAFRLWLRFSKKIR